MSYSIDREDIKHKKTLEALYGRAKATTLNAAILNFLSDLELTDTQTKQVAARQTSVRATAESNALIDIDDSHLIGSYARDTQIKSLNSGDRIDVDCLLVLKTSQHNLHKYWHATDGGRQLLEDLRRSLREYQGLDVKIDHPAVTISWSDMKMELVPAFHRQEGGFLIPANNGWNNSWQATSPLKDAEHLSNLNKATKGEFKPLIKMLKAWNRNFGKVLPSFAIETALYHSIGSSFTSFENELVHFFTKLETYNRSALTPPSGVGKPVEIQLSNERIQLVRNCGATAKAAIIKSCEGRHQQAIADFGLIFGKPFEGAV